MAGSDGERLLTPAEAGALLRVDPSTVSRWHRQGLIPGLRTPGGHRRFRESDVRALMQPSPADALWRRQAAAGAGNTRSGPRSQALQGGQGP